MMKKIIYSMMTLSGIYLYIPAYADIPLYQTDNTELYANLGLTLGLFHSEKNYIPGEAPGSRSWQEGFVQYGLGVRHNLGQYGALYAKVNWVSAATWGDGDAAGFTDGSERGTKIEDAYMGWKSSQLFPVLGEDGLDFSFGRQGICLGDGFLICTDAPNVGHSPLLGEDFDRKGGGTYYLAGHRAFTDTAMLKIAGKQPWHGSIFTFKSNNAIQAYSRFTGATLEYTDKERGSLALTYLHNNSVDQAYASRISTIMQDREGMDVYSLHGNSDLGIKGAIFSIDYGLQDKKNSSKQDAFSLKAGYGFDRPWQPSVFYRYSRFSESWDNLFIGAMEYGKWFPGEVAYNYAGPFNSNTQISNIGLSVHPTETITLGALAYDFSTLKKADNINYNGHEFDLYALWNIKPNITLSPLIGWYKAQASLDNGGLQNGDNKSNLYSQLTLSMSY